MRGVDEGHLIGHIEEALQGSPESRKVLWRGGPEK
jgi:hypothetical protein